jgi:hypothetical protein
MQEEPAKTGTEVWTSIQQFFRRIAATWHGKGFRQAK